MNFLQFKGASQNTSPEALPGIEIVHPVQMKSVFVKMDDSLNRRLKNRGRHFYDIFGTGCSRFMCSWSTTAEQVEEFCRDRGKTFGRGTIKDAT